MLIKVIYQTNEIDVVESSQLDTLISSNKIKKFLRFDGWVTVGIDPIRKENKLKDKVLERRGYNQKFVNR
jgi:hypothetical protein